jgi:hypothetical protein
MEVPLTDDEKRLLLTIASAPHDQLVRRGMEAVAGLSSDESDVALRTLTSRRLVHINSISAILEDAGLVLVPTIRRELLRKLSSEAMAFLANIARLHPEHQTVFVRENIVLDTHTGQPSPDMQRLWDQLVWCGALKSHEPGLHCITKSVGKIG